MNIPQELLKYQLAYGNILYVNDKAQRIVYRVQKIQGITDVKVPCFYPDYTYSVILPSHGYDRGDTLKIDFAEGIRLIELEEMYLFNNIVLSIPKSAVHVGGYLEYDIGNLEINFNGAKAKLDLGTDDSTLASNTVFKGYENLNCVSTGTTFLLDQCIVAPNIECLNLTEFGLNPFRLFIPKTIKAFEMDITHSSYIRDYYHYSFSDCSLKDRNKYLDYIVKYVHTITLDKLSYFVTLKLSNRVRVTGTTIIYVEDPKITRFIDKIEGAVIVVPKGTSDYISTTHVPRDINRVVELKAGQSIKELVSKWVLEIA